MGLKNEKEFRKELESLINRRGVDNDLHTPDFMITEWIIQSLKGQQNLLRDREVWHGRDFKFMAGKFDQPLTGPRKSSDPVETEFEP